jgi:hypothetical protein
MNDQQAITPFVSLDEAVLRIHRKWERIVEAEQKTQSARIECGMRLLELRARIETGEAGKITWWQWYEQKFARSRADAEKVMAIASDANPQAANEAAKARNAENNRAYRQRQRNLSRSRERDQDEARADDQHQQKEPEQEVLPPEPSQQEIEDQIVELFRQLHRQAQTRCAIKLRNILQGRE